MNHSHIPGFPNHMPHIDWQSCIPKFEDEEGDVAALHLIKFHMHSRKLKFEWHEDCSMKMFMAILEGKERSWYEQLPTSSLYSPKDFHTMFFENNKESYPYLLLVQNCCDHFEKTYEDDFMYG